MWYSWCVQRKMLISVLLSIKGNSVELIATWTVNFVHQQHQMGWNLGTWSNVASGEAGKYCILGGQGPATNPGEMEKKRKWIMGEIANSPHNLNQDLALPKCKADASVLWSKRVSFGFSVRGKSAAGGDQQGNDSWESNQEELCWPQEIYLYCLNIHLIFSLSFAKSLKLILELKH